MNDEKFNGLMARARGHAPFDTGRAGFGLETRVLARVREARRGEEGEGANLADELGKWVWRSAAGLAPVVALLVIWLLLWSGLTLDSFAYDALEDLGVYLPLE